MKNNTDEHLSKLASLIDVMGQLPESDKEDFLSVWEPFTAKRKEIITHAGEKEKYLYFVSEGVQRIYYFDDQGREATILFTYGPSFGGVLDAFMLQQPSKFYYESLTASTFLRTTYGELNHLIQTRPNIELMIRKGLSASMSGILERLVELQCYSSEEKFRKLLQRSPHILQLVPQKYLANYLGIDATNFSKLMNRVKI